MAIATLIIATLLLKVTGTTGTTGMVGAIAIGGVICIIAAIAGDTSQDLKTGFIVGATPKKQQIGEMIGVVVSAAAIGGVLYLLNEAWHYGTEELPAAQATMMKMLVEGIGGAVRFIVEKIKGTDEEKKARADRGVLFTSGLIAGEGIIGIVLAVLAVVHVDKVIQLPFQLPQWGSLIIFIALLYFLYTRCMKKEK